MAAATLAVDIADVLNGEFGSDLTKLSNCEKLYKDYTEKARKIKAELAEVSKSATESLKGLSRDAESVEARVDEVYAKIEGVRDAATEHVSGAEPALYRLSDLTRDVSALKKCRVYLQWLKAVESKGLSIHKCLGAKPSVTGGCRHAYLHPYTELVDLAETIEASNCRNLRSYVRRATLFWHTKIKEKLADEFEIVLQNVGWPFINTIQKTIESGKKAPEEVSVQEELKTLVQTLVRIQLPSSLYELPSSLHPVLRSFPQGGQLLLPVELLIRPLRKRFRFHFYGKKQTNSIDKPEWYLTQILTWIRDHSDYLSTHIQPLLKGTEAETVDVVGEFVKGLIVLPLEKCVSELSGIEEMDESRFSHLVDEVLLFDRQLRETFGYHGVGCSHALLSEQPFRRWLNLERQCATERMDAMLSSPDAWGSQYSDVLETGEPSDSTEDSDQAKLPECGHNLITLVLTLTERYRWLPYAVCRLLFLELELELVDDFRYRLQQIMSTFDVSQDPTASQYLAILNTLQFLITLLTDWEDSTLFHELLLNRTQVVNVYGEVDLKTLLSVEAAYRELPDLSERDVSTLKGGLFDSTVHFYRDMETTALFSLVKFISEKVISKARIYADNSKSLWTSLPSKRELAAQSLSTSGCPFLSALSIALQALQARLVRSSLVRVVKDVSAKLDEYLFAHVVARNYFSEGGAEQFRYDTILNLLPLVGKYLPHPEPHFKRVKESAGLLTLPSGTAMLLKDVLRHSLHVQETRAETQEPIAVLGEHNVHYLTPEQADLVLNRRKDLLSM